MAKRSRAAAVLRSGGVAAAVFPYEPERHYASAGVERFAAWVHESDEAMRGELEGRGYTLETSTCAMGMALGDVRLPRLELDVAPAERSEYLRYLEAFGLPPGLLAGVDTGASGSPRVPAATPRASRA